MKMNFVPKTILGKWSVGLIIFFVIFFTTLLLLIASGERGGVSFFFNLKLAISGLLAAVCAIFSFFIGMIAIIRQRERSIFVYIASGMGFFIFLFVISEILFPH